MTCWFVDRAAVLPLDSLIGMLSVRFRSFASRLPLSSVALPHTFNQREQRPLSEAQSQSAGLWQTSLDGKMRIALPRSAIKQQTIRNFSTSGPQTPATVATGITRFDLGLRSYLPKEWKFALSQSNEQRWRNIVAGVTVLTVTIPVSLGAAALSGVTPHYGLGASIVGAFMAAMFGGSRQMLSGAAMSLSVVSGGVIAQLGLPGFLACTFVAGAMQLSLGMLGAGYLTKAIPLSVGWAFPTAVGTIILWRQIPKILGVPNNAWDNLDWTVPWQAVADIAHSLDPYTASVAGSVFLACYATTKYRPTFPMPLFAVGGAAVLDWYLGGLGLPTLSAIPDLPPPSLPDFSSIPLAVLLSNSLTLFMAATTQALLSAKGVDKLIKRPLHDPSQELIGQGISNMACGAVGVLPGTGLIVQSTQAFKLGATSRLTPVTTALALLSISAALGSQLVHVPVPVLSGVLGAVALGMLKPQDILNLRKIAPPSRKSFYTLPWLTTVGLSVGTTLGVGVLSGIALCGAMHLQATGKAMLNRVHLEASEDQLRVNLNGSVSFLSALQFQLVRSELEMAAWKRKQETVFDFKDVTLVDGAGAEALLSLAESMKENSHKPVSFVNVTEDHLAVLNFFNPKKEIDIRMK